MKQIPIFVLAIWCALSSVCAADIVVSKNGDTHVGTILTGDFSLMTPYGKIVAHRDFIADITNSEDAAGRFDVHTVNNDLFSGDLANPTVAFEKNTGGQISVPKENLSQLVFETYAHPSHETDTTVFFMKNGDKFSGRLSNEALTIQTESGQVSVEQRHVSRMDFWETGQADDVEILFNNGGTLKGKILPVRFGIIPDSVAPIAVCPDKFTKIQFNVKKLVVGKTKTGEEEMDSDRVWEGVSDASDKCPQIQKITRVDESAGWKSETVFFDSNRYDIVPEHARILDSLAEIMKADPTLNIEIHGHTDNVAGEDYNMALSRNRAESVSAYLMEKGIGKERFSIFWHGLSDPRVSNETEEGRARNRRVELKRILSE